MFLSWLTGEKHIYLYMWIGNFLKNKGPELTNMKY